MPRLPTDRSDRIDPPPPRYKQHPLHYPRKLLIIIAAIGCLFLFFSFGDYSAARVTSFFLFCSIFFAMCDLLAYAQDPSEHPNWPQKKFLFGDLALAGILQLGFWSAVGELMSPYGGGDVIVAWAVLADGVCSGIHAYSFWKQLVAWYKAKWQAAQTKEPCARCGYLEQDGKKPTQQKQRPSIVPYVGPSAHCHQASVLTPASQESAMEEGLLIGSDFGYSDGLVEAEPVIEAEEVVVSKGKKKSAAAASQSKPAKS